VTRRRSVRWPPEGEVQSFCFELGEDESIDAGANKPRVSDRRQGRFLDWLKGQWVGNSKLRLEIAIPSGAPNFTT